MFGSHIATERRHRDPLAPSLPPPQIPRRESAEAGVPRSYVWSVVEDEEKRGYCYLLSLELARLYPEEVLVFLAHLDPRATAHFPHCRRRAVSIHYSARGPVEEHRLTRQ